MRKRKKCRAIECVDAEDPGVRREWPGLRPPPTSPVPQCTPCREDILAKYKYTNTQIQIHKYTNTVPSLHPMKGKYSRPVTSDQIQLIEGSRKWWFKMKGVYCLSVKKHYIRIFDNQEKCKDLKCSPWIFCPFWQVQWFLAVQTESDDSAIGDNVTHVTLLIETQKANFIMDGMRHLIRVIMRPDLTKKDKDIKRTTSKRNPWRDCLFWHLINVMSRHDLAN